MKIHSIIAGFYKCDGGALFGVVPKRVWQKRYPCDADNFCQLTTRSLLIDTGEHRILIDTGTGEKQLNYLKYYQIEKVIHFKDELQAIGYTCADITDVILTHLHFDHCGGCTYYSEKDNKNSLSITFPNAKHWVGKEQWENFQHPNIREGNSYFQENMMSIAEAGKLKLLEKDEKLCPEVELRLFNGHTKGQIVTVVKDAQQQNTLIHPGDVIPTAASIPIAWIAAYDTYPIVAMREKEQLLHECAQNKYTLFFGHDAYTETCQIAEINGKYRIQENQ